MSNAFIIPIPKAINRSLNSILGPGENIHSLFGKLDYIFSPQGENEIWKRTKSTVIMKESDMHTLDRFFPKLVKKEVDSSDSEFEMLHKKKSIEPPKSMSIKKASATPKKTKAKSPSKKSPKKEIFHSTALDDSLINLGFDASSLQQLDTDNVESNGNGELNESNRNNKSHELDSSNPHLNKKEPILSQEKPPKRRLDISESQGKLHETQSGKGPTHEVSSCDSEPDSPSSNGEEEQEKNTGFKKPACQISTPEKLHTKSKKLSGEKRRSKSPQPCGSEEILSQDLFADNSPSKKKGNIPLKATISQNRPVAHESESSSDEDLIPETQTISTSFQPSSKTQKKQTSSANLSQTIVNRSGSSSPDELADSSPALSTSAEKTQTSTSWLGDLKSNLIDIKELKDEDAESTMHVEDISSDEEVYLIQCPKELDIGSLKGKEITLDGCSSITLTKEGQPTNFDYCSVKEHSQRKVDMLLVSEQENSAILEKIYLAGNVVFSESVDVPELSKPAPSPSKKVDFPDKLKDICSSLDDSEFSQNELSPKKHKKKEKHSYKEDFEAPQNEMSPRKHKKKDKHVPREDVSMEHHSEEYSDNSSFNKRKRESCDLDTEDSQPVSKKKKKSKGDSYIDCETHFSDPIASHETDVNLPQDIPSEGGLQEGREEPVFTEPSIKKKKKKKSKHNDYIIPDIEIPAEVEEGATNNQEQYLLEEEQGSELAFPQQTKPKKKKKHRKVQGDYIVPDVDTPVESETSSENFCSPTKNSLTSSFVKSAKIKGIDNENCHEFTSLEGSENVPDETIIKKSKKKKKAKELDCDNSQETYHSDATEISLHENINKSKKKKKKVADETESCFEVPQILEPSEKKKKKKKHKIITEDQ